jgi:type I restriction enzyme M protein
MNSFEVSKPKTHETVLSKLSTPFSETALNNDAQLKSALQLEYNVQQNGFDIEALKKDVNTLIEHFKTADKNAKLKNDKTWTKYDLIRTDKQLEETLEEYNIAVEQTKYWYSNLDWLQKRFPEGKYQDVIGLCKIADRTEYSEEQDYSLNAGRYVGVEIEDDKISAEEFESKYLKLNRSFMELSKIANELEDVIF